MKILPSFKLLGEPDVMIIGGGPAASSTALYILRKNPELASRSLMVEKCTHPREKICGGALTLNAERIIHDLEIPLNIPYAPVHHVQLMYGHAKMNLPNDGCAKRVIRRCELDNLLFQTAKERDFPTIEGLRVRKVVRYPEYLQVSTDEGYFRAQVVVSADGVGAVVRKTNGFGPGKMGRLWVAEIPVDPQKFKIFTEQVLIIDLSYVTEGLKGYYWEFPCYVDSTPFISAGIVDSNPSSSGRIGNHDFLLNILSRRGINTQGMIRKAFPIRHFCPRERFSRPRMLLAGDALGSDPLFSEGISQALEFGRLAAHAVCDGFDRRDLSFSQYTKDVLRSRVGKELSAYARISKLFYGPRAELYLSMLYRIPELRRLIGCSYAGTQNMYHNSMVMIKHIAKYLLRAKKNVEEFRCAALQETINL